MPLTALKSIFSRHQPHVGFNNLLIVCGAIANSFPEEQHEEAAEILLDFRKSNRSSQKQNDGQLLYEITNMMEKGNSDLQGLFTVFKSLGFDNTTEENKALMSLENGNTRPYSPTLSPLENYHKAEIELDKFVKIAVEATGEGVLRHLRSFKKPDTFGFKVTKVHFGEQNYMTKKGLPQICGGAFAADNSVLIPMQALTTATLNDDVVYTKQTISKRGKEFEPGSKTKGLVYYLPDKATCYSSEYIQICEGFATGESCFQSNGVPTIAAMSQCNLQLSALSILKYGKAKSLIFGADVDSLGECEEIVNTLRAGVAESGTGQYIRAIAPDIDIANGDFNDLMQAEGLDAVRAAINSSFDTLATTPQTVIDNTKTILDDEGTHSTIDLLRHLPDDLLIKKLSLSIAIACHLPVSTVFLMGLSAFSSMSVRKYRINYRHAGSLPIGIYAIGEQPSGSAKSRGLNEFTKYFQLAHRDHILDCNDKLDRIDAVQISLNLKKNAKHETEEAKTRLLEAKAVSGITTNTTPEALEVSLKGTNGSFSGVASEQGLVNSLLGLNYGEGRTSNNDLVLSGFTGDYHSSKRVTRDGYSGFVTGGITLLAQSGSVETLLNASNGTGLSERFLMIVEPHNLGQRDWTDPKPIDASLSEEYAQICNTITHDVFMNPKNYEELPALNISNAGWNLINEFRNKIEPDLMDGGRYSHISLRGAAGKVDMQIMKVAANLHILSGVDIKPHDGTPDSEQNTLLPNALVISAIGIVADLLEHHLTMLESKGVTGDKAEWQAVIGYLSNKRGAVLSDMVNSLRRTLPFKAMTGSKPEAIKSAVAEMLKQALLKVNANGEYSVK